MVCFVPRVRRCLPGRKLRRRIGLSEPEPQRRCPQRLFCLKHRLGETDPGGILVGDLQARLWVQLMRELRNGVKLKKVQQKQFDPLPTEYQLTPFEMLMQDIRARNYKLRKVMVRGTGTVPSLSGAFLFMWVWALEQSGRFHLKRGIGNSSP